MASINQTLETSYKDLEVKEITPPSSHPKYKSVVDGDPSPSSFRDVGDVDGTNWSELESTPACDDDKLRVVSCHNLMETVGVDWLPSLRFGGTNMQKTRAYQLWPGKNVFFFRGRIICGPDPRGFLLTTVSIIISSWIFCVYIGGDSSHHSGLITGFAVVLTLMVLVSLFMVSAIDPGIIPRNDKPPLEADIGKSDGIHRKKVTVNGVEVKLKYCRICKIFRPPRSCHCAVCDNCVEKFDHHCPWIGQCIGVRNYRFYLMFLSSALVFFIYIFAFCCLRISRRMSQTGLGLFGMIGNCPETLSLATFSFVSIWFLGGLVSFHMYLITLNQTAYENYRQRYVSSPNPYYKGVLSNIKEVFFVRLPPSGVDFRAEVTPRWNVEGAMLEKSEESNFSNGGEAAKAIKTQASSETKGMSFQRSGTAILVDVA